jgi:hypothetical protein
MQTTDELIDAAAAVLHPHHVDDRVFDDVDAALVTPAGNVYVGVCIDTSSPETALPAPLD